MDIFVKSPKAPMLIRPEHFFHAHAHSHHSLKDGSIPIRDLVDKQVEHGAKAVACTDHGTMTGAWFLYDHIHNVRKLTDIKHIIGLEAYVSYSRPELNIFLKDGKTLITDKDERAAERKRLAKKYHQILLAKNKTGYFNLVKIHNDGWENGFYYSPTTTPETIFQNAEGLIATTTCLASFWNQHILAGDIATAERELMRWKEAFGDDFYVELQTINSNTQKLVNIELIKLARKTKTQMIITNDVHYLNEKDHEFHYILLNMGNLRKQADDDSVNQKMWEFDVDDLYLKTLEQMQQSHQRHHSGKVFTSSVFEEAVVSLSGIVEKVEQYSLESEPLLPRITEDGKAELSKRCVAGLQKKLAEGVIPAEKLPEYKERLIEELRVISALEAEDYILICNEITSYCHDNDIAVGFGRGSAGGSLVLYLLGVTGVDPVKWKLMFSRFLNFNRRAKLVM